MLNRLPRNWSAAVVVTMLSLLASATVHGAAQEDAKAQRKAAKLAAKADAPVGTWTAARTAEAAAQIDALVTKGYEATKLEPTRLTSDSEFVRRVYLDITGTIPNLDQTEAFLLSRDPQKRAKLIDALLKSPGYVSHNYNYWADLLRVKGRTRGDAGNDFGKWVKQSIQDNKPYDQLVYELITAEGKARQNGAAGYWLRDDGMVLDILANTARNFLGTQIGCAQCHDHPFDQWTQKQFYEMASYLGGVSTRMRPGYASGPGGGRQAMQEGMELRKLVKSNELDNRTRQILTRILREGSYGVQDTPKVLRYPNDYKYTNAKPNEIAQKNVIFGQSATVDRNDDPREVFAKWLTDKDNPRFTAVIANRMWKKVTGVGIVEPIDDWHDDTKGTNPDLLAYLTKLMIDVGYDLKQFQRILYNTKAYQLATAREELPLEQRRNQSALLRRMSAEQIWDSMLTLAVQDPDTRAGVSAYGERFDEVLDKVDNAKTAKEIVAIAEDVAKNPRQMLGGNANMMRRGGFGAMLVRASEMPQPAPPGTFLEQFGQSDRETPTAANTDPSVPQVLALLNGPITQMLLNKDSVLMKNVARADSPRDKIEAIYLSMLSRKPYSAELTIATQEIARNGDQGYANLIWAIANTREFIFIQ